MSTLRTSALALLLLASAAPETFAAPGRGQRATATAARTTTRTTSTARPAVSPRTNGKAALSNPAYVKRIKAQEAQWNKYVMEGWPNGSGSVDFYAAFAELFPVDGIRQVETVQLSYQAPGVADRSQRIKVSGVKDGIWRGNLIGIVSSHDLGNQDWASYTRAVTQRINADVIRVSYDHGPGTAVKVLANNVKSKGATAIPVEVPLKKGGITRVIYDRVDKNSGYVVGSSSAYVGRIVEIAWDGN